LADLFGQNSESHFWLKGAAEISGVCSLVIL